MPCFMYYNARAEGREIKAWGCCRVLCMHEAANSTVNGTVQDLQVHCCCSMQAAGKQRL